MTVSRIAVIGGDGIGPEVIDQAIRAAEAAARRSTTTPKVEVEPAAVEQATYYKQTRPDDAARRRLGHNSESHMTRSCPRRGRRPRPFRTRSRFTNCCYPMRRKFDQYVNLRPAYLFDGVPCPLHVVHEKTGALKPKPAGAIDMLVYRENTEGEYAPVGGNGSTSGHAENQIAIQTERVHAGRGCERILRAAFDAAREAAAEEAHFSITKSNAQQSTASCLWDDVFNERSSKDYTDVTDRLAAGGRGRDGLRAEAGECSTWWWRATCSATSSPT